MKVRGVQVHGAAPAGGGRRRARGGEPSRRRGGRPRARTGAGARRGTLPATSVIDVVVAVLPSAPAAEARCARAVSPGHRRDPRARLDRRARRRRRRAGARGRTRGRGAAAPRDAGCRDAGRSLRAPQLLAVGHYRRGARAGSGAAAGRRARRGDARAAGAAASRRSSRRAGEDEALPTLRRRHRGLAARQRRGTGGARAGAHDSAGRLALERLQARADVWRVGDRLLAATLARGAGGRCDRRARERITTRSRCPTGCRAKRCASACWPARIPTSPRRFSTGWRPRDEFAGASAWRSTGVA